MMTRRQEEASKIGLTGAIEHWWNDAKSTEYIDLNEDAFEAMAEAALAVLRGIASNQQYLREAGIITGEE